MTGRKKAIGLHVVVLIFFTACAFVHLLPLSLHPADSLNDGWDCLLNTWILGWDHHQMARNPLQLFEANVFHPFKGTLSYSETLLPLAVLSWPVAAATGNPILAYNFVFFLSCILNAYAMFLLVRHLTGRALSGAASGLIFAFSAVLMQQITHLQLVAAWFIPLAFLSLHRFFESGRFRHSALFALFLTLQALTCVYYGLFFLSLLPLILAVLLLVHRKKLGPAFLLKLGLPLLGAGAVLAIYARPFLRLFQEFMFQRNLEHGAELQNYLSVPPHNRLWGPLLHPLGSYEYFLFPGAAALALAAVFLIRRFSRTGSLSPRAKTWAIALSAVPASLTAFTLLFPGIKGKLGSITLSLTNPAKQAFGLGVVLGLVLIVAFVRHVFKTGGPGTSGGNAFLYLFVLSASMALSFGAAFALAGFRAFPQLSPFAWLYHHVPGFKGIRVPSRYAVFVVLAVAVLAGWGLDVLLRTVKKRGVRTALAAGLLLFINAEYWSHPQRLLSFPVGRDIPPTYRWLAERKGDIALVELPLFGGNANEAAYMYLSLFHKKKIVNGYSGFLPPTVDLLRSLMRDFPSQASGETLQELGVDYIVFHARPLNPERAEDTRFDARHRGARLFRHAATFRYGFGRPNDMEFLLGDDTIYRVLPPAAPPPVPAPDREIPPADFRVEAELNPELAGLAADGRPDTAWTTGRPKSRGEQLLIVFDRPVRVSRVSLEAGFLPQNAAANLVATWSPDGREWRLALPGYHAGAFVRSLVDNPRRAVQDILFQGEEMRFIRIEQTGRDPLWPWVVGELKVFEPLEQP
ncbi:MAG: hypothetical protein JW747_02060 [Candidatus Aminicenantes bacterium]|nr:hypothetical protein [Candidatus Aminicenantes bacterium]